MDLTTWELVSWELTSWEDTSHYSPNKVLVPFIVHVYKEGYRIM